MSDPAVTPDAPAQSLAALLAPALAIPAVVGAGVATTSIEDESIGGSEFDYYKVAKGKKDRLFFLTPQSIFHARAHYVEGQGFLICLSSYKKQGDKEIMTSQAACCQRLGQARKRCAGLVLQYVTNQAGVLQPADPLFAMKVWRFNDKTFALLRDMNANFALASYDFNVTLDGDEKYQGVNLMPCGADKDGRTSITQHPSFTKRYGTMIQEWVTAMQPQLERTVGRRLDAPKWAEILKTATGAPSAPAASAPADEAGMQSLEDLLNG